jgi:hypothetical protein
MNTLELAYALEANADLDSAEGCNPDVCKLEWNAATELRRLYSVNVELLEALKSYSLPIDMNNIALARHEFGSQDVERELKRRAAIAKAEGDQT